MDGLQLAPPALDDLDEDGLSSLAVRRDPAAFGAVMSRNNRRLFRVARSVLRDDAEAEEAVQEAYSRAFAALPSFRNQASLSTWLTRIVLNEALGRLRRRVRVVSLSASEPDGRNEEVASLRHEGDDPEDSLARTEMRHLIERAIDALPGSFRVVFVLRDVEEMTIDETAAALGLRAETVKTRLHRARRLLRERLRPELGVTPAEAFPFGGARCAAFSERLLALYLAA
jgi:RNA polymerase sigma-70 factor (ECF subfamily)